MSLLDRIGAKSEFGRNVVTLTTGTTLAQIIPIAISPILTRLFTPEEFGVFALYISIAAIAGVLATGRYDLAIMLPKKTSAALNVLAVALLCAAAFSAALMLVAIFCNAELTDLLDNPEISNWLYLLPITVFFSACYQSLYLWCNRCAQYRDLSVSRIAHSGSSATVNVGLGFAGVGSAGLIVGNLVGQIGGILALLKAATTHNVKYLSVVSKRKMTAMAVRYKKFPLYFSVTYGMNSLAQNMIPIILSGTFGAHYAGYYFLVHRAIMGPMGIVSSSIGSIFFQRVSQQTDPSGFYLRISLYLLIVGILPALTIYHFGPVLFSFAFGDEWQISGEIASCLVLMFLLSFITIPVSQLSTIQQKVIYNFLWQLALLIGILAAWHFGKSDNDVFLFFTIYALVQSALYIFGYVYEYRLCKDNNS